MLKKRIIPVLLLKKARMVKGKQFSNYRDTGDPISAAKIYNAQKADELMFLDIDASHEQRGTFLETIEKVSEECFMPFTVGGGIRCVEDVRQLLLVGADKVLINSAAVENPNIVAEASERFGKQCIVVGIDVKKMSGDYQIFSHGGRIPSNVALIKHIKTVIEMGAGEILINSIDNDGMMNGYDHELLKMVVSASERPVIACGGAGNFEHLAEAFNIGGVHAVACASLFHFGDNNPIRARSYLKNIGISVKNV